MTERKIVQNQKEECRMLCMRCKIYYKKIEKRIERKEPKYIRKELNRREVEKSIRMKIVRMDKRIEG